MRLRGLLFILYEMTHPNFIVNIKWLLFIIEYIKRTVFMRQYEGDFLFTAASLGTL